MNTTSRLGDKPRRPRTLALELVDALGERIRDGRLGVGDKLPTEAAIMGEFHVSRTVVREAISKMQASGLVHTRHGIGTFVAELVAPDPLAGAGFRIDPQHVATLRDVVAVLELRIGIETEAAGLAAQRRNADNLDALRRALAAISCAIDAGADAVASDFQFHLEVARATQNPHFSQLMATLGSQIIPRARLESGLVVYPAGDLDLVAAAPESTAVQAERLSYLRRVHVEHESIYDAIQAQDAEAARAAMRTHLANSRERRRRAAQAGELA
jgi:DNA-binding FadR family transcriptional regulator